VGIRGGAPVTDYFSVEDNTGSNTGHASYVDDTRRYILGPTFAVHFPLGFSLTVDALYRKIGFTRKPAEPLASQQSTLANAWQFPVMLRWTYTPTTLKPSVALGPNFQKITGIDTVSATAGSSSELANSFTPGFAAGAGFEVHLGVLRLEPELRYTHWGSQAFEDPVHAALRTNVNQADFLFGITF
jgi:hypothetical protein